MQVPVLPQLKKPNKQTFSCAAILTPDFSQHIATLPPGS